MKKSLAILATALTLSLAVSATTMAATELKWGSCNAETTLREQAMAKAIEEINENAEIFFAAHGAAGQNAQHAGLRDQIQQTLEAGGGNMQKQRQHADAALACLLGIRT